MTVPLTETNPNTRLAGAHRDIEILKKRQQLPQGTRIGAWALCSTTSFTITNPIGGTAAAYAVWSTVRVSDTSVFDIDVGRTTISCLLPGYLMCWSEALWPVGAYFRQSSLSGQQTIANSTSDATFGGYVTDDIIEPPGFGTTASVLNYFDTFNTSKTINATMIVGFVALSDTSYTDL